MCIKLSTTEFSINMEKYSWEKKQCQSSYYTLKNT